MRPAQTTTAVLPTVAAIGETHELEGFALVGVAVFAAETPSQMIQAWRDLDHDVGLVILSPAASAALRAVLADRPDTLTVTMP